MLLKLDINRRIVGYVHEVKRRSPLANELEVGYVGRVIEPAQLAVINTETVLPYM